MTRPQLCTSTAISNTESIREASPDVGSHDLVWVACGASSVNCIGDWYCGQWHWWWGDEVEAADNCTRSSV